MRRAGSVLGTAVESLEMVMERWMVQKLLSIMDNNTHPLHYLVSKQKSVFSGGLRQLSCRKDRFKNTFYLLKLHFVITYPFQLGQKNIHFTFSWNCLYISNCIFAPVYCTSVYLHTCIHGSSIPLFLSKARYCRLMVLCMWDMYLYMCCVYACWLLEHLHFSPEMNKVYRILSCNSSCLVFLNVNALFSPE